MEFWIDNCEKHGFYYSNIHPCPRCEEKRQNSVERAGEGLRALTGPAKVELELELEPISLGRWEEQTDHDREFLQACGISTL